MVDDAIDAEDIPGVRFGHLRLAAVGHYALQGHHRISRADPDRVVGDEAILFQRHPDGVGDLIIAVVLGGLDLDSVNDVASAGDPPGEQFGQTLVRQTFDLAIERHDSVGDRDFDIATSVSGGLGRRSGPALLGVLNSVVSEGAFLQYRRAHVIPDRTITHRLSRSDADPVYDSCRATNRSRQFQRDLLGGQAFGFALKDNTSVWFVLDNNRIAAKVYALIASESLMNLAYDSR